MASRDLFVKGPALTQHVALDLINKGIEFCVKYTGTDYVLTVRDEDVRHALDVITFFPGSEQPHGQLYVLIDLSSPGDHFLFGPDEVPTFAVLGQDAVVYSTIMSMMDNLDDKIEDGHTLETAQIFSLVPVPLSWTEQALALYRKENEDETT